MRTVYIRNPDLGTQEKTFLTAAYASGTSLSVINNFAFAADNLGIVGQPGEEKTESKKISAISGSATLTLASALNFAHPKDTPVFKSPWDQVEISSRVSSGAWSVLSTSGLQWDKPYTLYVHSAGDTTYDYRWRFYNSVAVTYSEYSPTYAATGFTRDQVGYMIREVRKITRTQDNEEVVSDREIIRQLNSAHDIIYGIRKDWWFLKFEDSTMKTVTSSYQYNLDLIGGGVANAPAANFTLGYIDKIRFRYNDGTIDTTYPLKFRSENEFDGLIADNLRQTDDNVNIYTLKPGDSSSKNGYAWVYPTPATTDRGTFVIRAFRKFQLLDDDIDTTPLPIPEILENYVISFIERVRGNDAKADYYQDLFYGPPPAKETNRRLTGIALLEQLQARQTPTGQAQSLSRFRGQKSLGRYYGNRPSSNRDYLKENFF